MGNRAVVTFNNRSSIEKYIKDASRPMHLEGYVEDHPDILVVGKNKQDGEVASSKKGRPLQ